MCKLRLSSHQLEIERGRWYNGPASEESFCDYCQSSGHIVEDEIHFLLHCPMSKKLRVNLLPMVTSNDIALSDSEKFVNIMTGSDRQSTAKSLHLTFENRDLCLEVLNTERY